MRRAICLLTAVAMALQATGIAFASYTYDDAGRTETIDKFGETTTFEYDEASRPEKMTYDTGAYALYTYDGRSRIKAVEHKNSSNTLLRKETNVYDPASRITSRYEGPASGGVTTTFTYDDVGQLTGESSSGYSASYTYDANGNRATRTVNSVMETYTVDDSDKLTSVTWSQGGNNYAKEYAYHYSGRVTGITYKTNSVTTSSETLTWNKENRLISRGTDTYTYNGLNTRVAKSDGGGSFTYKRAGANQTAPVLADGAANYLPGISEKRSGTSTFLHSGIKNAQLQTNSSQLNTATNRYDAFGNVLATTGTWKGSFGYGGKFGYQTDDVDMELLGDRYFDPSVGRFLSRDSAKDGRNWYAYGAGESSPISAADSAGKQMLSVYGVVIENQQQEYWSTHQPPRPPGEGAFKNVALLQREIDVALRAGSPHAVVGALERVAHSWKLKVQTLGIWDYHSRYGDKYEAFGNFNYGLTGRHLGLSEETLLRAGGAAQVFNSRDGFITKLKKIIDAQLNDPYYGDSKDDSWWIERGIEYYDKEIGPVVGRHQ